MKLFRRGSSYLVMHSVTRAWRYDADTGAVSRERPMSELVGSDGRDWLPVLNDAIPDGLRALLVVRFPKAE